MAFAVSPSSLQVGTRVRGKRKNKHGLCEMKLFNQARGGPIGIYGRSRQASIHSIYFIIWVLWTVTWQKGHAMRARRKHGLQSPFISHSAGVFILRTCGKTLQRAPGRELGTQPSLLSAMHLLWPVQVPHAPDLVGP